MEGGCLRVEMASFHLSVCFGSFLGVFYGNRSYVFEGMSVCFFDGMLYRLNLLVICLVKANETFVALK